MRLGRKWERFSEADFGYYRNKFDGFEGEVLFGSNPFESGKRFSHGEPINSVPTSPWVISTAFVWVEEVKAVSKKDRN